MGDETHKAGEPGDGEQTEAKVSEELVEDAQDAADDATVPASDPLVVGDARHGQTVVHNDPGSRDGGETFTETVDDPTRIVHGDGTVEQVEGEA